MSTQETIPLTQPEKDEKNCDLCKRDIPVENAVWKNGHCWHCKPCHNLTTMMRRNLDVWPAPEFLECTPEEQSEFFKKNTHQEDSGKRVQWKVVKCGLIDCVAKRRKDIWSDELRGQCLPLSVWQSKGFDVGLIEQKAEKEEHPILGATYRVDLEEVNFKVVVEKVTEQILRRERSATKNPKAKVKGKAKKKQADGDDVLFIPSDSDVEDGATKREQNGKDALEKQAEKVAREVTATASKVLPQLLSVSKDVADAVEQFEVYSTGPFRGKLSEDHAIQLKDAAKTLQNYQDDASDRLSRASRGARDLHALTWSAQDCQADMKAAQAQVTSFKQEVKRLRKESSKSAGSNAQGDQGEDQGGQPNKRQRKTEPKSKAKAKAKGKA